MLKTISPRILPFKEPEGRVFNCYFPTPFGRAWMRHDHAHLYSLFFQPTDEPVLENVAPDDWAILQLCPKGTSFQQQVWQVLVDFGRQGGTFSYQDVACALGAPQSARAVGQAVGKNPIGYLIPCHKVISKDGSIGGFAWGLELKKKMLAYDQAL